MPKLTIAGAPANTAWRIAAARKPTLPPQAKTLTPGAEAIFASARIPVITINDSPWSPAQTRPLRGPRSRPKGVSFKARAQNSALSPETVAASGRLHYAHLKNNISIKPALGGRHHGETFGGVLA